MRPIDADALIAEFEEYIKINRSCGNNICVSVADVLIETTIDAPTIEQPTWISVEDRLPLYNERVLAYVCGRIEPLTLFYRDLLVEDYWEDDVQRVIILRAVTHWMPLPQPPKGVE